jgi:hypothetical protein
MNKQEMLEAIERLKSKLSYNKEYLRQKYSYYYFGTPTNYPAKVNNIFSTVNQLESLIFSADHLILEPRLDDSLDETESKEFVEKIVSKLADVVSEDFRNTKSDDELSKIILDALITKNGFGKIIYNSEGFWETPKVIRLNPYNVAVGYDSFNIRDYSQIIMHRTFMTAREFEVRYPDAYRKLKAKQRKEIAEQTSEDINQDLAIKLLPATPTPTGGQIPYMLKPDQTGVVNRQPVFDLVEMIELWYYNLDDDNIEHKNKWVENIVVDDLVLETRYHMTNPFFSIITLDYATDEYGYSVISLIESIQDAMEDIYEDVQSARKRLINPPVLISGFGINPEVKDEIERAIKTPGSVETVDAQGVKIDTYESKIQPQVAMEEKQTLEQDAQKVLSMTSIMQGVPAKNVRSASYAQILSQFSSAPIKKIAVKIEKQIEDVINILAEIYINASTIKYKMLLKGETLTFNFSNLSLINWGRIVIYAHSSSPIIEEQNQMLLMQLADMGIVPKEVLVEILDLPFKDRIKAYLKKQEIEQQAMVMAQQHMEEAKKQGDVKKDAEKKK